MTETVRMNPEIKARWVAWLRANTDKQGYGRLQSSLGFCCLGGLCELAVADGVIRSRETENDDANSIEYGDEVNGWDSHILPQTVIEWAGLQRDDPLVDVDLELTESITLTSLSHLNDGYGWDFNKIASVIEEQL